MNDIPIRSSQHPQVKHCRQLLQKSRYRKRQQQFVAESPSFIRECLLRHQDRIVAVLHDGRPSADAILAKSRPQGAIYLLDTTLFNGLSTVSQSIGIILILSYPAWDLETILHTQRRFLILDGVQQPGNVGAIIRNAVAFAWDGVCLLEGCADPFHPDAIRAMAGYAFHLPLIDIEDSALDRLLSRNLPLYFLDADGTMSVQDLSEQSGVILVMGSEAHGIHHPKLLAVSDLAAKLRINMVDGVDSLNVAVSAGIAMHRLYCA